MIYFGWTRLLPLQGRREGWTHEKKEGNRNTIREMVKNFVVLTTRGNTSKAPDDALT